MPATTPTLELPHTPGCLVCGRDNPHGLHLSLHVDPVSAILQSYAQLLSGQASLKNISGPITIAQAANAHASIGLDWFLSFLALLSLSLCIMNLLPIPILDGGHIFIMALEGVARRDFSTRVKEKMLLAGFVVLMMLMVTVIYNDLARISWINNLMPWR